MSTVELYDPEIWPLVGSYLDENNQHVPGEEVTHKHFEQIRKNIWLIEHPCAGNIDTTILYGKWVGDASQFQFVEYNPFNWFGWNYNTFYSYGSQIVKYRWGTGQNEVDIFVFFHDKVRGDIVDANPPILGGQLNDSYWKLSVDPNKYSHWNKGAGRPDIGSDERWIVQPHGEILPEPGRTYGYWEAWKELPIHTDPFHQEPYTKFEGVTEPQHKPVEQQREWITQDIRPRFERTYTDGVVGTPPYTTPWVHSEDPVKVSEYAYKSGEPVGSTQIGPSYIDPKYNQALQDRVIHCIEHNYLYLMAVDTEWKESFEHWCTWGQNIDPTYSSDCPNRENYLASYEGTWQYPYGYVLGDVVYYNLYWWRCIQTHTANSGNYPQDGSSYWKKPKYQPDYVLTDPLYVKLSSILFNCNSSAFERVLKVINKFDWYYDSRDQDGYPAVPWWIYQGHYLNMTLHKADPDGGYAQTAVKDYPLPSGCWRRVWRYTMCWDNDRPEGQKARLGKVIEIDGEQVSMMWPGDLGLPPGMDEIEAYYGEWGGYYYNYRFQAYITTRELYNNMNPNYKQYYIPEDELPTSGISIEDRYRERYRAQKNSVESRLKAHHDPLDTEWYVDEHTAEEIEVPVFELEPDLINDLKEALEQMTLLGQDNESTTTAYVSWPEDTTKHSTSLDAYTIGKAECEAETIRVFNQAGFYGNVGYVGFVVYDISGHYHNGGSITHDYQMEKAWMEVTITKDTDNCFPADSVGRLIIDIQASASSATDAACAIGIPGVFSYTPPQDGIWHRAYIGNASIGECNWEHDGGDGLAENWDLKCKFRIIPAQDWPDEAIYDFSGPDRFPFGGGIDQYIETNVQINTSGTNGMAWLLDFNGFDSSVFEQDPANVLEVT